MPAKIISRKIAARIDGALRIMEIIEVPRGIRSKNKATEEELLIVMIPKEKAYNYLLKNAPEFAEQYKKDFGDKYSYCKNKKT